LPAAQPIDDETFKQLLAPANVSLTSAYFGHDEGEAVFEFNVDGPVKAMLVGDSGSGRTTTALLVATQQCNSPDLNQATMCVFDAIDSDAESTTAAARAN
jgi:ABC-type glutathione transport system ATPase component